MSESTEPLQSPAENQPAPPSLGRLARHALIFGGASGALGAVSIALGHARGAFTSPGSEAQWFLFTAAFLAVIATCLAIIRWRDRALGGSMRFAQAASVGLMVGLVNAAAIGVGFWIYAAHLDPGILEVLRASAERLDATADPGAPPRPLPSAGAIARGWFTFFLLLGFIIALSSALILRKRRPR